MSYKFSIRPLVVFMCSDDKLVVRVSFVAEPEMVNPLLHLHLVEHKFSPADV